MRKAHTPSRTGFGYAQSAYAFAASAFADRQRARRRPQYAFAAGLLPCGQCARLCRAMFSLRCEHTRGLRGYVLGLRPARMRRARRAMTSGLAAPAIMRAL